MIEAWLGFECEAAHFESLSAVAGAITVPGKGLAGEVHAGFLESVDSLWPVVRAEVKKQLAQAGPATPLFITGHSKGGGMAPLAAMRFRNQEALSARVITFAAPKSGNKGFADAYNAVMTHTRYEFAASACPPSGRPRISWSLDPRLKAAPGKLEGRHRAGGAEWQHESVFSFWEAYVRVSEMAA